MTSIYFDHPDGRIHALRFGAGPTLLIALHGFGDRARMFAVLEKALSEKYTVVALDWPFHGQTKWGKKTFEKEDLLFVMRQVLEREGKARFNLMAFSFGARLAQGMLPALAPQLDKLYLLSPDGVKTKGMSMAARTPVWLRRLLFRILQKPAWFIALINAGRRLRVVPPLIHHFLSNNLNRPERFRRTFGCWLAMDSFYLRRRDIQRILEETGLPTDVYIGSRDPMLGQETLKKLFGSLPNVRLFMLEEEGHRVVGEALAEKMMEV